jgi:hypothetical protein
VSAKIKKVEHFFLVADSNSFVTPHTKPASAFAGVKHYRRQKYSRITDS